MRFAADERGLSRLISYTLTITVAMIFITGLLFAGSQLVEDQRDRTVRDQMEVVGQQVAGSLEAADRLNRSTEGEPRTLNVTRSVPDRVANAEYTIEIDSGTVVVREAGSELAVEVTYRTVTDVAETTVSGGPIVTHYDNDSDRLVVDNA